MAGVQQSQQSIQRSALPIPDRSHSVEATVSVPAGDPLTGVVIAQGGAYGGWSFYAHEGRLAFAYNLLGISIDIVTSDSAVPDGDHELRAHFAYDGGGVGKGGTVSLHVDDATIGEGRVERTLPYQFTFDETVDVGCDLASPVSTDYGARGNEFSGTLHKVRIDLGDDDHSHLIDPEHRLQVAMLKQ